MAPIQTYTAECHCKRTVARVTIPTLEAEDVPLTACNCTICTKHALAVRYCKRKDVEFTAGEKELTNYFCGSRTRVMRFCSACGVVLLFDAHAGADEPETVIAVNACAIEGYNPDEVMFKPFDGLSVPIQE